MGAELQMNRRIFTLQLGLAVATLFAPRLAPANRKHAEEALNLRPPRNNRTAKAMQHTRGAFHAQCSVFSHSFAGDV
jgi:hypothetical protein